MSHQPDGAPMTNAEFIKIMAPRAYRDLVRWERHQKSIMAIMFGAGVFIGFALAAYILLVMR
jgi:hypothetical protein